MLTMNTPLFINPNGDDVTALDIDNLFSDLDDLLIGAKILCESIINEDSYEGLGCAKALTLVLDKMKVDILKISVSSLDVSAAKETTENTPQLAGGAE